MMTSLTKLLTMVPKAPPMMMPTAMSTTLPRMANSLNSLNIIPSFVARLNSGLSEDNRQKLKTTEAVEVVSVLFASPIGWLRWRMS